MYTSPLKKKYIWNLNIDFKLHLMKCSSYYCLENEMPEDYHIKWYWYSFTLVYSSLLHVYLTTIYACLYYVTFVFMLDVYQLRIFQALIKHSAFLCCVNQKLWRSKERDWRLYPIFLFSTQNWISSSEHHSEKFPTMHIL